VEVKQMLAQGRPFRAHAFELACARNDIDHRLTKPKRPWTNGQVERMNRTIKDATVKRYFYETHGELRAHLTDFVTAYNFASAPSLCDRVAVWVNEGDAGGDDEAQKKSLGLAAAA
jgi:transposase InsO family protein